MGARGPRAQGSGLTVIGPSGIEAVNRPEPPQELTDEMAQEWRAIVQRMPADWFPAETHPLLIQYVKHVVRARRISHLIASAEESDPFHEEAYMKLLDAEERQSRAMSSLATRMRLSQQATYDQRKAKGSAFKAHKLWE
jgi:hypothetical protein